ncbi:MAG: hypothetical protein KDK07_09870 [Bauldia sp.]|nr:hypothetical protein [Bauldia sp.]
MTDTERNGLGARLRRLPGQLLLALVNATAVLVIVAAVLVLVAYGRIDAITERLTSTVTAAVMSQAGVDPKAALADLDGLRSDVRALTEALATAKSGGQALLAAQAERLEARLDTLQAGLAGIRQSRTALLNEALSEATRSLADALGRLQGCVIPTTGS